MHRAAVVQRVRVVVRRDPRVALQAGDVVEVTVDGVPPLSNPVAAA